MFIAFYRNLCAIRKCCNVLGFIRDRSVGIGTGWMAVIRFPWGPRFSLPHNVQNGSGAHQVSYTMGTRGSFPVRKADHSPPSGAEIENGGAIPSLPHVFIGAKLIKHRGYFTFLWRGIGSSKPNPNTEGLPLLGCPWPSHKYIYILIWGRIHKTTVIMHVVLYGCETWSLTLSGRLRIGCWGKYVDLRGMKESHNELRTLYSLPNIRSIKQRKMRWTGHAGSFTYGSETCWKKKKS
jgi:hypothetical protein